MNYYYLYNSPTAIIIDYPDKMRSWIMKNSIKKIEYIVGSRYVKITTDIESFDFYADMCLDENISSMGLEEFYQFVIDLIATP